MFLHMYACFCILCISVHIVYAIFDVLTGVNLSQDGLGTIDVFAYFAYDLHDLYVCAYRCLCVHIVHICAYLACC